MFDSKLLIVYYF